jgi:MYXO-CTERM domain-containing protein
VTTPSVTRTEPYRLTRAEADQLAAEFRSGAAPVPVAALHRGVVEAMTDPVEAGLRYGGLALALIGLGLLALWRPIRRSSR